jgi:hypothetical protein
MIGALLLALGLVSDRVACSMGYTSGGPSAITAADNQMMVVILWVSCYMSTIIRKIIFVRTGEIGAGGAGGVDESGLDMLIF